MLACQLGGRVEVSRRGDRRFLIDHVFWTVAVDPDRAAIDQPPDARAPNTLQHRQRSPRVRLLGVAGAGVDLPYVGNGGQMDERVAIVGRPIDGGWIGDAAENGLYVVGRVVGGGHEVQDPRDDAGQQEPVDDMRADESRAACDQDPHAPAGRWAESGSGGGSGPR